MSEPVVAPSTPPAASAREEKEEENGEEKEGEEEEGNPWESNPKWNTRENTPGKRKSKSDVWGWCKRLGLDHPKNDDFTHICIIENCPDPLMKLYKDKNNNWGTSRCVTHLKKHHATNEESKGVMEAQSKREVFYCLILDACCFCVLLSTDNLLAPSRNPSWFNSFKLGLLPMQTIQRMALARSLQALSSLLLTML